MVFLSQLSASDIHCEKCRTHCHRNEGQKVAGSTLSNTDFPLLPAQSPDSDAFFLAHLLISRNKFNLSLKFLKNPARVTDNLCFQDLPDTQLCSVSCDLL